MAGVEVVVVEPYLNVSKYELISALNQEEAESLNKPCRLKK